MSHQEHQQSAQEKEYSLPIGIITISDSRTADTDKNYQYLSEMITQSSHVVIGYEIVPDEAEEITAVIHTLMEKGARLLLLNGGTGISPRDCTYDTLSALIEKPIPGFGEIFRMLSWDQVGSASMLSRATAGIYKNVPIFSTPGSNKAVRLAWEKLIYPQLDHFHWELNDKEG